MIDDYDRRGKPIPEELYPPLIMPGAIEIYSAFWELSTERSLGMASVGPIPALKIDDWLDRNDILDHDERDLFRDMMRQMDRAFLPQVNKITRRSGNRRGPYDELMNPPPNRPPLSTTLFDAMFGRGKVKGLAKKAT